MSDPEIRNSANRGPNAGRGLHPHRCRIDVELEVLSPLHVGTGAFADGLIDRPDDDDDGPGVATIVRDGVGRPYLPGSSVKGLLRRLCDEANRKELFGDIRQQGGVGRMSAVFVWGADCLTVPEPDAAPYAKMLAAKEHRGAFIAARTAIDAESGTADHNKLFFQEMVPAGARFRLRLLLLGDTVEQVNASLERLKPVLARLAAGAALGKGQADGQGRVKLAPETLKAAALHIDRDGRLAETPIPLPLPDPPSSRPDALWSRDLRFVCDWPFVVADSSHAPADPGQRDSLSPDDPRRAQIKAQRLAENRPLVLGSSVMGALRARAAWLLKLRRHRGETLDVDNVLNRLFGEVGFRGLLALERVEVEDARPWSVTSVRLDRFSGAPIDNALFTTAAFLGVTLRLTLTLEDRGGRGTPSDDERTFAETLIDDITRNGLTLGHGTNKGFGWFEHRHEGGAA